MISNRRPNVLVMMADQLRRDWLGYNGAVEVSTPNIDELARKSMNFKNAICNSPLCAPSRISLATSQYPYHTGVFDNRRVCPPKVATYYQLLRREGYRVGIVGKSDLHKPVHRYGKDGYNTFMSHYGFSDSIEMEGKMIAAQTSPSAAELLDAGRFEEVFSSTPNLDTTVGPYQSYLRELGLLESFVTDYRVRIHDEPIWHAAPSILPLPAYQDWYIGQRAKELLQEFSGRNDPWHLFVSFVGPHDPWDAPAEFWNRYEDARFAMSVPMPAEGKPSWLLNRKRTETEGMSTRDLQKVKTGYAAMITLIDSAIGEIIGALREHESSGDTIVVFLADHGEFMGDFGLLGKTAMYEPALRVPLLISAPKLHTHGVSRGLAELVDLYPTILDLCDVRYDASAIDGKSLVNLLADGSQSHKHLQYAELFNCRMIFDGRYKYIENYNDIDELYDLVEDPSETRNIAAMNTRKASELRAAMNRLTRQ